MNPNQGPREPQHSTTSEQSKHRKRPSLYPLRNSSRRKASFQDDAHLFNPHLTTGNASSAQKAKSETDHSEQKESVSSFFFQSPTYEKSSGDESQRTPRSVPKEFVFDTPFVPFTHQSLTRSVWRSDETIPEEKDEMDRKESQMMAPQENIQEEAHQCDTKSSVDPIPSPNANLSFNQHTKKRSQLTITPIPHVSCHPQSRNANTMQTSGRIQLTQIPTRLVGEEVSQQTAERTYGNYMPFNISIPPARRSKLSFTDLFCVSVLPTVPDQREGEQQTEARERKRWKMEEVGIGGKESREFLCQTSERKLGVDNKWAMSGRKSVRREHYRQQTESLLDRLSLVSRNLDLKVGVMKKMKSTPQQTFDILCKREKQVQTQMGGNKCRISPQPSVQFMMTLDYKSVLEKKITDFEQLIRDLVQNKEKEESQGKSSFGTQCDDKMLGSRTSLKRVSIADTKLVYNLTDETPSVKGVQSESENRSKSKSRKKKVKGMEVKIEKEDEVSDFEEEIKKSKSRSRPKKKQGKTPLKKSKK